MKKIILLFIFLSSTLLAKNIKQPTLPFYKASEHFKLYCKSEEKEAAQKILEASDKNFKILSKKFEHVYSAKINLYVFPNIQEFRNSIELSHVPDWTVSASSVEINSLFIILPKNVNNYDSVENNFKSNINNLTYLFVYDAYEGRMPWWFRTGVCGLLSNVEDILLLQSLAQDHSKILSFKALQDKELVKSIFIGTLPLGSLKIFDSCAYSIVDFINNKWGWEKILELLKDFSSFEKILGVTQEEFREQWINYLDSKYTNFECKLEGYENIDDEKTEINRKLFKAIDEKDKKNIKQLVNDGADINAYMFYENCDQSPIHWALHNKSMEIAEFLLTLGANINSTDEFGETPLHYCESDEYLDFAKKLIQLGANVNARRQGDFTPLHFLASEKNTINMVKLLIKNNADIYSKDLFGFTPIAWAIYNDEIFEYFLRLNVNININFVAKTSLLHLAVLAGNERVIDLLTKRNMNVNQKALFGIAPIFLAIGKIIDSKFIEKNFSYGVNDSDSNNHDENFCEDDDAPENIIDLKINQLKILELLLRNGANIHEKTQSINEFLKQNLKFKKNIEKNSVEKYKNFKEILSFLDCDIKNPYDKNELGFNLFHSFILQHVIVKQMLKYKKDDLKIGRQELIDKYEKLNSCLHFLLKNYKDIDSQGYSPYELIKKNYSVFVKLVEENDKNKELTHIRKLLKEIK
ncbi:ankyrin repeat domain-containing protein [Candidatus Babeliales bacterium]|nr:ankyrin repeat domain-containing protein [Candidatus Babeliales bacterium]